MQTALILSDAVLLACALAALWLARPRWLAVAGFALMAAAALAGCLRYGPAPQLLPLHQGLSFLAGTLGMPLVLLGYLRPSRLVAAFVIGELLLLCACAWLQPGARLGAALATLLGWTLALSMPAVRGHAGAAIALGLLASLAAAVFARNTQLEALHYALALSQLAFGSALRLQLRKDNIETPSPTQATPPGETCHDTASATPRLP